MGKALSTFRRPLRNFNIEDRAHKVISRDKPLAAPKYPSDVAEYDRILKHHPEIVEETLKKHEQLDKYLKNVYVTSEDPAPKILSSPTSERLLPEDRSYVGEFQMGFKEPTNVPVGKATLKNIMRFIGMYQNNPKDNTADKIAIEYDLDVDKVKNILKYVRAYEVYTPENNTRTKAKFAGPSLPRKMVKKIPRMQLPPGKIKDHDAT